MTAAPASLARFASARGATAAGAASLIIATLNRPVGDTGVHAHTRVLHEGLVQRGIGCDIVSPFSGSRLWLPVFAMRPALIKPLNKTWGTLWYRHWHEVALRRNLLRRVTCGTGPITAVVAQCPVSARAALDVRRMIGGRWPVSLVCHFNHSEAREYRTKGELRSENAYQQMLAAENRVLADVDHVVYVSGWARDVVENERGVRPRSSSVVWNGLPDLPHDSGASRYAVRAILGLQDGDLAIVNIGTLEPRKNQLALLDLFARISAIHPLAHLFLVGDGPQRSAIENRIHELNLGGRVTLLGMRRDVPALLSAADVYLHYATAENCPVVLIEAARAGLPVAAIPAGGVPELLREIGGVALSADGDLDASLRAIAPLLNDPAARARFGARAREAFERRFVIDAMVNEYLKVAAAPGASEVAT